MSDGIDELRNTERNIRQKADKMQYWAKINVWAAPAVVVFASWRLANGASYTYSNIAVVVVGILMFIGALYNSSEADKMRIVADRCDDDYAVFKQAIKWEDLELGMSEAACIELLGRPNGVVQPGDDEKVLKWLYFVELLNQRAAGYIKIKEGVVVGIDAPVFGHPAE